MVMYTTTVTKIDIIYRRNILSQVKNLPSASVLLMYRLYIYIELLPEVKVKIQTEKPNKTKIRRCTQLT